MRPSRVTAVILSLTTSAAALVGFTSSPTASAASAAAGGGGISLVGNGYGHGRGLSQWGAHGAASQGASYEQILRFYYPGLKVGRQRGTVSVLISADTSDDVMVAARTGLQVTSLGSGRTYRLNRSAARWWRITAAQGGKRSAIAWKPSRGGWRTARTVPGEAQFEAGGAPIMLRTPAGNRSYRGILRSASPGPGSGQRDTVNVVRLDDYLKGVVPREVPALWPTEAVRAQAVAARTYAAFERRQPLARHYQICDTAQCQVYGGYSDEFPASNRAIQATAGQVLLDGGKPAFTQFSASNGGYTLGGTVSYLPAKEDPFDTAYRGWRATVTGTAIAQALPAIGTFQRAEVIERDGNGAFGGRVVRIRIVGSKTSTVISGDSFRSWFGLRSTMFRITG
ncbi:SpoIID/LytB domain-containing protein [Nocardioides sp. R-C-SC26]|uniref:SpoIID/LytB domain-containing protein n=1 Tax=Nocardioides sp. R-C-SC26 TaxID=2870414 RepID=UPI001E640AE7|nr:SpoIID/LytB domain-containing protein [Nocardioides sp. R-C-SC26]